MNKKENTVLFRIGNAVTRFAQRFMPDAYLFALLLTALVFLLGILVAGQTPMNMIVYFHKNIWSLLEFGMQLCLMLVLSTVSVGTRPISHLMKKIASIPKTPGQAIVFGSFIMLVLFSVNSTFALVFGAIYAKETARCLKNVHYPLLVAVCYCGYITWQGGLGGTTPLLMATEGSWASELLGHTIPLMDIILSPLNLTLLILMIVTIPVLAALLVPRQQKDIITVDASVFTDETMPVFRCPAQATFAQKLEYSRIPTLLFGIFISVYIVSQFGTKGIKALDINMLNLVLLALSLLFVDNAMDLLSRVSGAAKITSGVIIQFPIYAGIMGMVSGSGLGQMISNVFIQIANVHTLPNILHLSSSLLNIFVPSGGGQWAIEAPIYLPVAERLGIPPANVVIAASYGDALTNLIQPFWAIPLLSITKLSMRDIMGYCTVICIYGLILTQLVFFIFSM